MKRGWWTLKIEMCDGDEVDEISDITLEHIAMCITEGYTSGEVNEDEEEEEA